MNKLFSKIAALSVGLAMAVGVGVAVNSASNKAKVVSAETEDVTYTISNYEAGTQYAENEEHVLDSVLTIYTNQCHFTSEIRMYQDTDTRTNWVKFVSLKKIAGFKINANCNSSKQTTTYNLKGSNDGGENYTDIDTKTTGSGTSYSNLTFSFAAETSYTTLLLKNTGSKQGRVKSITVTYVKESATVDSVSVSGEAVINSGYLGYKNVKYTADVIYSAGQGDESVTWSTNSASNTINQDGVLHITSNETTIVTATSKEDTSKSGSITVTISGLALRDFSNEPISVDTATFGTESVTSSSSGTPAQLDSGNINFSVDKNTSQSNPGYITTSPISFRIYGGATLTISTKDGNNMYFVSLKSVNAGNKMSAAIVSLDAGVVSIDEDGEALIDLSASPVSSFTITASAQFRFDSVKVYYLVQTDAEAVQEFVDNYMHMSDYTEELGYCSDDEHHYYADAKAAFNGLSAERRSLFMTGEAYVDAKERLIAWATANHDVINGDNLIVSNESNINQFSLSSESDNTILIIIIVTSAAITMLGVLLIALKKKKHN